MTGPAVGERYRAPGPAGAGRFLDLYWPNPNRFSGGALDQAMFRGGASQGTGTGSGAGGGSANAIWKGVECAQLFTSAAAGSVQAFYPLGGITMPLNVVKGAPLTSDELQVWRILANMAFQLAPAADPANNDFGLQITNPVGTIGKLSEPNPGYAFQCIDLNTVLLRVLGPNGVKQVALTAAPFDVTTWHSYEFRQISATASAEAQLQVLIDGVQKQVPQLFSSWAAGTNLPTPVINAPARTGFTALLVNSSGVANSLFVKSFHAMAAPTVIDTL